MKKLDWYILKRFLGTFFYAILLMAVVSCVIDYSEKVEDFVKHHAPVGEILNYYKNFMPHITALLYPLFVFIATIFFTSKLAYKSEIIAMLASGISFTRFMRPYFVGAALLGVLALFTNHWIVPESNKERLEFENTFVHEKRNFSNQRVHLRLSKNLYVYVQQYDYGTNMGSDFTAETIQGTLLKEKLTASRISYDSVHKMWTLYDVVIRTNDSMTEKLVRESEKKMKYAFSPEDLRSGYNAEDVFALTTAELMHYIDVQRMRSAENLNPYMLEEHRRTAQPFAGFILTIMGACIASRKVRGGSGIHLVLGVIICALYVMLMQFSNTFSINAGFSPLVAVWIPNAIFAVVAVILYRQQTK